MHPTRKLEEHEGNDVCGSVIIAGVCVALNFNTEIVFLIYCIVTEIKQNKTFIFCSHDNVFLIQPNLKQ
jgi:hypothetical protein